MGNIQMEANQIRYKGSYRTVQEALDNGSGGGGGSAAGVTYNNATSHLTASNVQAAIDEMVANFGAGVDDVYNACVSAGSTPASKSPADIATAIGSISGGGADIVLNNALIADDQGAFITAPLDGPIDANKRILVSIKDGSKYIYTVLLYSGGTNIYSLDNGVYELTITTTTAGLSNYTGDWRKIYAIISVLDDSQVYS